MHEGAGVEVVCLLEEGKRVAQYICPECNGNVRTIGTKKGTRVSCRHCGTPSFTTEDNL